MASSVAASRVSTRQGRQVARSLNLDASPRDVAGALRRAGAASLFFDSGRGGQGGGRDGERTSPGWSFGPLCAVDPQAEILAHTPAEVGGAFTQVAAEVAERRRRYETGSAATGIAMVASYEAGRAYVLGPAGAAGRGPGKPGNDVPKPAPSVAIWRVERSVRWNADGEACLTVAGGAPTAVDRLAADVERRVAEAPALPASARAAGAPVTSLPREDYLRAVQRVLGHIRRGDVYQANLCQRIAVPVRGDAFAWYAAHARSNPAPRGAWAELPGVALASASPETFLRVALDGTIETWPIKGTRPRSDDPHIDRQVARELLAAAKDRAELLMIVDLERNDLGRVCRVGSVTVPELATLRSYATVHHLVARVTGALRPDVDVEALLAATFPGGSITGAPKRRAMELLAEIEPVARGWFTGSLIWFGDDGTVDSSILIRSPVFGGGHAFIGAGGGIVADSDPEAEWHESNHKARAAARALGFDPEDAS